MNQARRRDRIIVADMHRTYLLSRESLDDIAARQAEARRKLLAMPGRKSYESDAKAPVRVVGVDYGRGGDVTATTVGHIGLGGVVHIDSVTMRPPAPAASEVPEPVTGTVVAFYGDGPETIKVDSSLPYPIESASWAWSREEFIGHVRGGRIRILHVPGSLPAVGLRFDAQGIGGLRIIRHHDMFAEDQDGRPWSATLFDRDVKSGRITNLRLDS